MSTAQGKRIKRTVMTLIVTLVISLLSTSIMMGTASASTSFDIEAESGILIEAETGKILFEKNVDMALPPASMSKMMTEYLVLEAIHNGQFDWDTVVTASDAAYFHGTLGPESSVVYLNAGDQYTIEQLYTALAVYSGNDATVALAEQVAGTEANFVQRMNEKAAELGMTNTHFVNSTGLPNSMLENYIPAGSESDENLMSARDTAILARALVNDYPEVLRFSSIPADDFVHANGQQISMINWNWMLPGNPQADAKQHAYEGIDGLKTGYTSLAGNCFTGTAERDGIRFISVVMRSESRHARFEETRKLLDYGFNHFEKKKMVENGTVLEGHETLPVVKGKEMEVPIAVEEDIYAVIHQDEQDLYTLEFEPDPIRINEEGAIMAPVEEGEAIGQVRLQYHGELDYGYIQENPQAGTTNMLVQENVEKAGWLRLVTRSIQGFFSSVWGSVVDSIKGLFS